MIISNKKAFLAFFKSFICGMIIGSLCFGSTMYVNASSSAYGAPEYVTINGVFFTMQNSMFTGLEGNDAHKYARAYTDIDASMNLGAGFMAVRPRINDPQGNLVVDSAWSYSSSNTSGLSRSVSKTYFSGTPAFCSKGLVLIWNGTAYINYSPLKTPSLQDYTW